MPIRPKSGLNVHDATYHTGDVIPASDQDFGGYRLKGLKRMTTVPSAADVGTDGLVLYEGLGAETYYGGNGDTTTGGGPNVEFAYKITLPTGTITKVRIKFAAANTNVKLALYDDDGGAGEPATQLKDWGAFTSALGVTDFDVADYAVSAGDFWLGSLFDAAQLRYAAGTTQHRQKARNYALGLESPWPNATDDHYAAYNFYEQLAVVPVVDRLYLNIHGIVVYVTPDG